MGTQIGPFSCHRRHHGARQQQAPLAVHAHAPGATPVTGLLCHVPHGKTRQPQAHAPSARAPQLLRAQLWPRPLSPGCTAGPACGCPLQPAGLAALARLHCCARPCGSCGGARLPVCPQLARTLLLRACLRPAPTSTQTPAAGPAAERAHHHLWPPLLPAPALAAAPGGAEDPNCSHNHCERPARPAFPADSLEGAGVGCA